MTNQASNGSEPDRTGAGLLTGNELSVRDLTQFLRDIGKSLQRPSSEPLLGEALVKLSNALRRHHDKELEELFEHLAGKTTSPNRQDRHNPKPLDGVNVQTLGPYQITELLTDDRLSKKDLIEVGSKRLGISESLLVRQNKPSIRETLTAALQNEEAYHVIAKEAEREGIRRAQVRSPI